MVLADHQIAREVRIDPWSHPVSGQGLISYGVSSYGYDLRLGRKFRILKDFEDLPPEHRNKILDPKVHDPELWEEYEGDSVVIRPHSFVLGETLEYLEIPRGVIVICLGKSTYARVAVVPHVTPLEPEWKGKVTLEISNSGPMPVRVYANEGILQALFLRGETMCRVSYADKAGKYQNQTGLTHAVVR